MDALIVRHSCMGDIICAEPVARLMKKLYESVSFDAGPYAEIFENHPDLTDISLLKEHQIFDLTHVYERKLSIPIIQAYLEEFGRSASDEERKPQLFVTDSERRWGKMMLPGRWAIIDLGYPGGALQRGFWEFDCWKPLCEFVRSKGFNILYIGGGLHAGIKTLYIPIDQSFIDLDMRGLTTIRQLFSLIANCSLFFGVDSGPMHIAQAFGVPGVAIFKHTHPSHLILNTNSSILPVHAVDGDPFPKEGMLTHLHTLLDKP